MAVTVIFKHRKIQIVSRYDIKVEGTYNLDGFPLFFIEILLYKFVVEAVPQLQKLYHIL